MTKMPLSSKSEKSQTSLLFKLDHRNIHRGEEVREKGEALFIHVQMWPFFGWCGAKSCLCLFFCPPSIPFQFRQLFLALATPHASGAWFLSGCVCFKLETRLAPGEGLDLERLPLTSAAWDGVGGLA